MAIHPPDTHTIDPTALCLGCMSASLIGRVQNGDVAAIHAYATVQQVLVMQDIAAALTGIEATLDQMVV